MHATKAAKQFGKLAKKGKEGKVKVQKQKSQAVVDDGISIKPKEKPGKEKEKDKKKGKRNRGTPAGGSSNGSSVENLTTLLNRTSKIDAEVSTASPVHHKEKKEKLKKKIKSKECEEAVSKAVTDFWESAWHICEDRFFVTSAPITVSLELRNTWLRMVEAEWQDADMRENDTSRPNRIFLKDEPPLPLAFDTWARGALETLPRSRRESVLDPFLRDMDYFSKMDEEEEEEMEEDSADLQDSMFQDLISKKPDEHSHEDIIKARKSRKSRKSKYHPALARGTISQPEMSSTPPKDKDDPKNKGKGDKKKGPEPMSRKSVYRGRSGIFGSSGDSKGPKIFTGEMKRSTGSSACLANAPATSQHHFECPTTCCPLPQPQVCCCNNSNCCHQVQDCVPTVTYY